VFTDIGVEVMNVKLDLNTIMTGCILALLGWVGTQMISFSDHKAKIEIQQKENDRVNEIVYTQIPVMNQTLARIETNQQNIQRQLNSLEKRSDALEVTAIKNGKTLSVAFLQKEKHLEAETEESDE
jgi:hypothetical protein